MDDVDLAVRRLIYAHFGRTGRAPTRAELAADLGRSLDWVDQRFTRLAGERAVVLGSDREITMALPFSAAPSPFRVVAGGVTYHGNCAWDAFGLAALFGPSSKIDFPCGHCDERFGPGDDWLVHFAVPAAWWWEDIGFT
jgi:hypothetical protein